MNNLETLPAASDIEDINSTLKRDGGCIIENVLSSGEIDQILKELNPYIEKATIGFDDLAVGIPRESAHSSPDPQPAGISSRTRKFWVRLVPI